MDRKKVVKYNSDYAIQFHRWGMQWLGIWPNEDRFSKLRYFFSLTMTVILLIPTTMQCFLVSDFFKEIETFLLYINIIGALFKPIFMKTAKRNLRSLVENMIIDWNTQMPQEAKKIMIFKLRNLIRLNKFCVRVLCFCAVVVSLMPLLRSKFSFISDQTVENVRFLPFPSFYPFDTQISPVYEMLYISQIISFACLIAITGTINTFLILLVFHLCGQLQIVALRIKNMCRFTSKIRQESCLKLIVKRHVELARNSKMIENSFKNMILIEVVVTVLSLCILGYSVVVVSPASDTAGTIKNTIYFFYPILMMFFYCYIGENLIGQSTGIAGQVYDLNWYDYKPSFVRSLTLIMIRSQKQMEITAGKFFPMSFHAFKQIVLTAVSYATVLLATSRKN